MALSSDAEQVLELAYQLDANEKLEIAERLIAEVRQRSSNNLQYDLGDLEGLAKYPMMGEDAQAWVSRTRREADEKREVHLREAHVSQE